MIAGDLNLALDPNKDAINRKNNNSKSAAVLNEYMESADIVDVWRQKNPDKFCFTFQKRKPREMFVRLDYILINQGLVAQTQDVKILPAFKSDHGAVVLNLNLIKSTKHTGLWKFNNSLLKDSNYTSSVSELIQNLMQNSQHRGLSKASTWERLKSEIVCKTKEYAKERSIRLRQDFTFMQKRLTKLLSEFNSTENSSIKKQKDIQIAECNAYLEQYIEYKAQGARVRSRLCWWEYGEKSTSYYLSLEKIRSSNKSIKVLVKADNTMTKNEKEILQEQHAFYKRLYTANPNIYFSLTNQTQFMLNEEQKNEIDSDFTYKEFRRSLNGMQSNKAPGLDGLTVEFYKCFFYKIGKVVWEAVLEAKDTNGYLFLSVRRGVVSLIPKKNKDLLLLKNWRPLTLLNVDCKIVTKMISNRVVFTVRVTCFKRVTSVPTHVCAISKVLVKFLKIVLVAF